MKKKIIPENQFDETGLTSNMEDYLEKIAMLSVTNRVVRVKDIAESLKIKMPSVTAAIKRLGDMGFVNYEKYGYVELTEVGRNTADRIWRKHGFLQNFFSRLLLLDSATAEREACKIEHHLEAETFEKILVFMNFLDEEKSKDAEWIKRLEKKLSGKK